MKGAIISNVDIGSYAHEGGILKGHTLLTINNQRVKDIFDYKFLIANENLILRLLDENGEEYILEIEKDMYEDLGIDFDKPLIDNVRQCSNKCLFCFIDQMPEGMRRSLYFKDDDIRLSFLMGNYVTLTNLGKREFDRIIDYRISPLNISIHTTNPKLRALMLGNKKADNILERLEALAKANITINGQLVLCPGYNDGLELERTLKDLYAFKDNINSLSLVPVGLTKYRENLRDLRTFTQEEAKTIIDFAENFAKKARKEIGRSFIYVADEFYVNAKVPLPSYESYDDFPQIENGVGMLVSLKDEIDVYLEGKNLRAKTRKVISIATGYAAYDFFVELAEDLSKNLNLDIRVYRIRNDFFGPSVTVAGLLTGQDLIRQLKGKDLGERLLISKNMLKHDEDIFLDDVSLLDLSKELGIDVLPVSDSGKDFVDKLLL